MDYILKESCKNKTKVILRRGTGKRGWKNHDWFPFNTWLVEIIASCLWTNHVAQYQKKRNPRLLSTPNQNCSHLKSDIPNYLLNFWVPPANFKEKTCRGLNNLFNVVRKCANGWQCPCWIKRSILLDSKIYTEGHNSLHAEKNSSHYVHEEAVIFFKAISRYLGMNHQKSWWERLHT